MSLAVTAGLEGAAEPASVLVLQLALSPAAVIEENTHVQPAPTMLGGDAVCCPALEVLLLVLLLIGVG